VHLNIELSPMEGHWAKFAARAPSTLTQRVTRSIEPSTVCFNALLRAENRNNNGSKQATQAKSKGSQQGNTSQQPSMAKSKSNKQGTTIPSFHYSRGEQIAVLCSGYIASHW